MKRTCMPKVAGVLNIVNGILGLVLVFGLFAAISFAQGAFGFIVVPFWIPVHTVAFLGIIVIPGLIFSLLALTGGIMAMQRKSWGLSLAGSMASLFIFTVFGLISTILIALAKDEFVSTYQYTSPNMEKAF